MRVLIPNIDILIGHGMVTDSVLRMALEIARRKAESSAEVMCNADFLRIARLRFELCIPIGRRIELIGCRRDKIFTIRNISMRHRINVIPKADARTVVAAECRVAVMTNACRELQCGNDTPLILKVEGAVQKSTITDTYSAAVLDRRIILRKLKARCQQVITKLLVKLVAKSPCLNVKIIKRFHGQERQPIQAVSGKVIIILTAGDTHLILCRIVDLHIPNQVGIKMIIVPKINWKPLLFFIEGLIVIRVLIGTEIQSEIGRLAQILANVNIDRVGIQFRWCLVSMRVLEVTALVLLVLDTPIPAVRTALICHAIELATIAAVADAERCLHSLRLLRDDVDDTPLCI